MRGLDSLPAVRQFGELMVFPQGTVHGRSLQGPLSTTAAPTRNPHAHTHTLDSLGFIQEVFTLILYSNYGNL